jgi:hypothetical protein
MSSPYIDERRILKILLWMQETGASGRQTAKKFECAENSISKYKKMYTVKELLRKYPDTFKQTSEETNKLIDDAATGLMNLTKKSTHALNMYIDTVLTKLTNNIKLQAYEVSLIRNILQVSAPFVISTKGINNDKEQEPIETMFDKVRKQAEEAVAQANVRASKSMKNAGKSS